MDTFSNVCEKLRVDSAFTRASDVSKFLRVHNIHELKHVKKVWLSYFSQGNELCINRKWCVLLDQSPALKQLLKEGKIEQYRSRGGFGTNNTYLRLKK